MVLTTLVVCTLPHSVVAALLVCECQHCPIMFLKDWSTLKVLSKYLLKQPPTTESQPDHLTLQWSTLLMLPVSLAFVQQGQVTYKFNIVVYRECTFVSVCPSMPINVSCSRCSATCYMRCVPSVLWLLALPWLHATAFVFTSLLGPLPLCVVAGVYFDPDVYSVNEGGTVTLILRTNVTVNKRFSVLVNTRDDSATSK